MGEAEKALAEGDKLLNARPSSFLAFFSGGNKPDFHEAAEKYSIAGNLFKAAGEWASAGDAYLKSAAALIKEGIPEEAARKQLAAAACFRKAPGRAEESISLYSEANIAYIRSGRFAMVGNNEKECADICEKELGDKKRAADFYAKAAERYLTENSPAYLSLPFHAN
jgi:tetratricopeptide (TPR) repeat protein